jgi:uncharacterized membrane protein YqhA
VGSTEDTTLATYETDPGASMATRLLGHLRHSRYLFYFAVVSTLLAVALVMVYGTVQIVVFVVDLVRHGSIDNRWGAELRLTVIEVVDLFLIGTVLFVIAVGLYQLFFTSMMPLPRWLLVQDVGDLERKLIGLVITVLSVVFLGQIVTWNGQRDLLGFGVGIGAVIAALTFFLRHERRTPHRKAESRSSRRPGRHRPDGPTANALTRKHPRCRGCSTRGSSPVTRAPLALRRPPPSQRGSSWPLAQDMDKAGWPGRAHIKQPTTLPSPVAAVLRQASLPRREGR